MPLDLEPSGGPPIARASAQLSTTRWVVAGPGGNYQVEVCTRDPVVAGDAFYLFEYTTGKYSAVPVYILNGIGNAFACAVRRR